MSKIIGKAFKTINVAQLADEEMMRNIACIGVAPWGYIQHNHLMESYATSPPPSFSSTSSPSSIPPAPPPYEYDAVSRDCCQLARTWGGKVLLDSNHTHFLLVDNGTTNKFGYEHLFRADVERHLAKTAGPDGAPVPHVVVLCEGTQSA